MGEVKPQDETSGLVARSWVRRHPKDKAGVLTQRTLEGQPVEATWQDRQGHVQRVAGTVVRTDAGELAIESWADGERRQTPVIRDANVDVMQRPRNR
jgi:hypothetical protein